MDVLSSASRGSMSKQHSRKSVLFLCVAVLFAGLAIGFTGGAYWHNWPTWVPAAMSGSSRPTATLPQPKARPTPVGADRMVLARPLAEHVVLVSIDGCRPDLLAVCETP